MARWSRPQRAGSLPPCRRTTLTSHLSPLTSDLSPLASRLSPLTSPLSLLTTHHSPLTLTLTLTLTPAHSGRPAHRCPCQSCPPSIPSTSPTAVRSIPAHLEATSSARRSHLAPARSSQSARWWTPLDSPSKCPAKALLTVKALLTASPALGLVVNSLGSP